MKTTVCALMISGKEAVWGHIGDTRLYLFSSNKVRERTLDHSVPQMLVLAHEITEKNIRHHPDRNRLLRALGAVGDSPQFELSRKVCLDDVQAFLLCTDGFWENVLEKEMSALLKKSNSPEDWINRMVKIVSRRENSGNIDNYSAIAVWM